MEEWKIIDEAPDYWISNQGRVQNRINGRMVKSHLVNGYPTVVLFHDGRSYKRGVHRLVAVAFVNGQGPDLHVAPIDGNKTNTNHSNLEWITQEETNARLVRRGAIRKLKKWIVTEDGSLEEIEKEEH